MRRLAILVPLVLFLGTRSARAETAAAPEASAPEENPLGKVQWGAGAKFRFAFVPKFISGLFLDHTTRAYTTGFAIEGFRRKGDLDVVFGVEYARIFVTDGLWLEKGDDPDACAVRGECPDYLTDDGFGYIGLSGSMLWHRPVHPRIDLRYGAGLGLAIMVGDLHQFDTTCPAGTEVGDLDDKNACARVGSDDNSVPPVLPLVTATFGARFLVAPRVHVVAEIGLLEVVPSFSVGSTYRF